MVYNNCRGENFFLSVGIRTHILCMKYEPLNHDVKPAFGLCNNNLGVPTSVLYLLNRSDQVVSDIVNI